jgi:hypothetical protein
VDYSKFLTALLTPERVEPCWGDLLCEYIPVMGKCLRDSLVRGKLGVYIIRIPGGVTESNL